MFLGGSFYSKNFRFTLIKLICVSALKCLLSWSLIKNLKQISKLQNSRDNIKYIQGIRFFIMLLVMFGHIIFITYLIPYNNTKFFEDVSFLIFK